MTTPYFGFISVDTHPRIARLTRVRVDGVAVTRDCFAANDKERWADCYVRGADGRLMLTSDQRSVRKVRLRGDVVIDFPLGLD